MILRNLHTFVLKETRSITRNVKHLAFAMDNDEDFPFTPGQFITIHIEAAGQVLKRSYSIASIPSRDKTIDIAVSYVDGGIGSKYLFDLQPGDKVPITGPFGRLVLRDEQPQRYFLVATGTGVTPYRSMLPELAERIKTQNLKVFVFLGVQTRDDLLYGQDFIDYAKQFPNNFTFRAYYSRMQSTELNGPYEFSGYVHSGLKEYALNPDQDLIYLCGNPNMIDQAYEFLKEIGFEQQNVRREKYISAK